MEGVDDKVRHDNGLFVSFDTISLLEYVKHYLEEERYKVLELDDTHLFVYAGEPGKAAKDDHLKKKMVILAQKVQNFKDDYFKDIVYRNVRQRDFDKDERMEEEKKEFLDEQLMELNDFDKEATERKKRKEAEHPQEIIVKAETGAKEPPKEPDSAEVKGNAPVTNEAVESMEEKNSFTSPSQQDDDDDDSFLNSDENM